MRIGIVSQDDAIQEVRPAHFAAPHLAHGVSTPNGFALNRTTPGYPSG